MLSLGAQLTCSPKPSKLPSFPTTSFQNQNSIFLKLNPSLFPFSHLKISRRTSQSASATITAADDSSTAQSEKLGVVVKLMEKPRIVLKFIWVDRHLGLALEQLIPGHGSIPLGPYYFWPRKDALSELKVMLQSKPWISEKQAVIFLEQATDIINMWQQRSGDLS